MERWSKLKLGANLFLSKFDRKNSETVDSFTFWLSDYKTLWSECINSKDNLLQRLADDNPALTITDEIFDQLVGALNPVESTAHANTDIKPGDEEIKLQLKLSLGDKIQSQFHWFLKKCDSETFFEQITKSLLYENCELKQLIDIVKKKDDEIKQHKLEGARPLERKRFITDVFNADEFTLQSQVFDCTIDDIERIVGKLPKKPMKNEANEAGNSPKKPTVITSYRPGKNRLRLAQQKIVKPGDVKYLSDDDNNDESTSIQNIAQVKTEADTEPVENTPRPTIPSPKKRIRRDFNI